MCSAPRSVARGCGKFCRSVRIRARSAADKTRPFPAASGATGLAAGCSTITFPSDHVEHVERRYQIGKQTSLNHACQRLGVGEAWGAGAAFVGLTGAVADEIEADLAVGRLGADVHFAGRR